MEAVDSYIPTPERTWRTVLMPVETYHIGTRTVATAEWRGQSEVNEQVEIVNPGHAHNGGDGRGDVQEAFGRRHSGDNVGCCYGVERKDIERGQVIAKPGALRRTRCSRPKPTF